MGGVAADGSTGGVALDGDGTTNEQKLVRGKDQCIVTLMVTWRGGPVGVGAGSARLLPFNSNP